MDLPSTMAGRLRILGLIFILSSQVCTGLPDPLMNATKTYNVASILMEPFLMEREEGWTGNQPKYEGFVPDLLRDLEEHLGVKFKVILSPDNRFGDRQSDGHWDGMVGQLIRKDVDLAAGPLTITSRRGRVIDFSKPFMSTSTVMVITPSSSARTTPDSSYKFSMVLKPFTPIAWLMLVVASLMILVFAAIIIRISPAEEKTSYVKSATSLLTTCSGGGRYMYSPCVLRTTLVIFGVITLALYTAGAVSLLLYTARLENRSYPTEEQKNFELLDIADIVKSQQYKIVVVRDGASQAFFRHSSVPLYHEIYQDLRYVDNVTSGFDLLLKDPTYAFITDKALVDYFISRRPYCGLKIVGSALTTNGYGLGYPIHSPLHDLINLSILEMRENGRLAMLHKKWWHDRAECAKPSTPGKRKMKSIATPGVDGHTLGGVMIILAIGLLLAVVVGVIERALHFRSSKVNVGNRTNRDMDGQPLHLGGATNRDLVLT